MEEGDMEEGGKYICANKISSFSFWSDADRAGETKKTMTGDAVDGAMENLILYSNIAPWAIYSYWPQTLYKIRRNETFSCLQNKTKTKKNKHRNKLSEPAPTDV